MNLKTGLIERWYIQKTPLVLEDNGVTLFWDFTIYSDRTIKVHKPHLVLKDIKEHRFFLLDINIASDKNIAAKEFDKLSK